MRGVEAVRYAAEFDVRSVYDFLISLSIGGADEPEISDEDMRWLREARASLPADVRAGVFAGSQEREGLAHAIAPLVVARPEVRDAAAFVAAVEGMAPRQIVEAILQPHDGEADAEVRLALLDRALAGDRAAVEECGEYLRANVGEPYASQLATVLGDPVGAAERLHLALRAWLEQFRAVEPRVAAVVERDAAARRDRDIAAAQLVEEATGGIRFMADPTIRRVILAPSYFARPYNWVFGGPGWRAFCYPVAESSLGPDVPGQPPASTLRLYRALGDASRLRILRLLAERDMYLTEIAQVLELSKPTIKHHLAELRAAGLVTMTEEGALTYYALRRERVDEASGELKRFLS